MPNIARLRMRNDRMTKLKGDVRFKVQARSKNEVATHMASVLRATAILQPICVRRLTAIHKVSRHWKAPRSANLQPLLRFTSVADTVDGTVALESCTSLIVPEADVHAETLDQAVQDKAARDDGGHGKKSWSWKSGYAKEREEEGVVLKVLPGLGEPKALKFRLGKKHVTMDSVRDENMTGEELAELESDESVTKFGDLPKTMEGGESEETAKLVKTLRKKLSMSEKDQTLFASALPSVFGTTVGGAREVAMTIKRAGFKKSEVSSVFPRFPTILEVNYDNVARVYKVLQKEYKMNRRWLQGLLRRHPYVFTLGEGQIRERMDALVELGLRSREIASLILHHPLLLFSPLSSEALDTARQAKKAGLSSKWLTKSLFYNLHYRPARIDLGEDVDKVVELLDEYDVNTADVLTAHPQMLTMQSKDVESVIHLLSSFPLYLNSQDIRLLLDRQPELFAIQDMGKLRSHLSLLCDVLGSSEYVRFIFRSVVSLLHPDCDVQGKLDLLMGKGFSKEQATSLVTQCPSLLSHDTTTEFTPKLELLMQVSGVGPSVLTKSPRSYFLLPLDILKARYSFAHKHNAKLLQASRLVDLFCTTDKEFAVLCGCTMSDYYNETGLTPIVRRRGRPRKNINTNAADSSLPISVSPTTPKDVVTALHLGSDDFVIDIEDDTTSVGVESELDSDKDSVTLDGLGMGNEEFGIATSSLRSVDGFSVREDFDIQLQYNVHGGSVGSEGKVSTGRTSNRKSNSPHFYHSHTTKESVSRENNSPETTHPYLVKKHFPADSNTPLADQCSQRNSVDTGSKAIVGTDSASPNQHNQTLSSEALESSSDNGLVGGGCGEGSLLLELPQDQPPLPEPAVHVEIQDNIGGRVEDGDITLSLSSSCEEKEEEEEAVDLDSFASKEVSDLLQELRREAATKETSHQVLIKGRVRMSEIDSLVEDGVQFDFIDDCFEADTNSHSRSSRII